jgi:hypothetical protein
MSLAKLVTDVVLREAGAILDDVVTSEEERGQLRVELKKIEQAVELRTLDERIAFAQHPSVFVAGARPFIIWAAGVGIATNFVLIPLANTLWPIIAPDAAREIASLDWDKLLVLSGLAGGTSWVRHLDKVRGVARSNLRQPDASDIRLGNGALY